MDYMITLIIVLILAIVAIGALLVWRAIRFAIRLALIGLILFAMIVGALVWWYNVKDAEPTKKNTSPAQRMRSTH
jgi:predicted lysophospholipase L1 biosynthesis ABC-type transport system permease subunit